MTLMKAADNFVKYQGEQTILDWGLETKCLTPVQHSKDSQTLRQMYGIATA